ncbi:hypothetical protein [Lacticaseibacillus nasuensis]|uniref:hypothetical protein n=1 Tax=Lacticaseibacillus nasuensis TaxID=944671 RepID=UPI002245CAA6|nr:hypothetical protein [Lacticaseibacillus nasuensis]MCX2454932.1 hypothetical protein [Lacticaseibacillus nasuensis]
MKKLWPTITVLWLASIAYFLIYANSPALRATVNGSGAWSIVHGIMDLVLFGGALALILHLIDRIRHPRG